MYTATLQMYLTNLAADGVTISRVEIWPGCDVGAESTYLPVIIGQTSEPYIWLFYDDTDTLNQRINVGQP